MTNNKLVYAKDVFYRLIYNNNRLIVSLKCDNKRFILTDLLVHPGDVLTFDRHVTLCNNLKPINRLVQLLPYKHYENKLHTKIYVSDYKLHINDKWFDVSHIAHFLYTLDIVAKGDKTRLVESFRVVMGE